MKKLLTLCLAFALCVSVGVAFLVQSPAKKVSADQTNANSLTVAATDVYTYTDSNPETHMDPMTNPSDYPGWRDVLGMNVFVQMFTLETNLYLGFDEVDVSNYRYVNFRALIWADQGDGKKYSFAPVNIYKTSGEVAYTTKIAYSWAHKDASLYGDPYVFQISVPTSELKDENGKVNGLIIKNPIDKDTSGWVMVSDFTFCNETKADLSTDIAKTNIVTNNATYGIVQDNGADMPWVDLNLRNRFEHGGGVAQSYVATFGFENVIPADSVDYFKFKVLGWSGEGYRSVTVKNLDGTELRTVTVAYAYNTYKTYDIEVILPAAGLENADGMIGGFVMECAVGIDHFAFSDITACKGTPDYSIDVLKSSTDTGVFQRKNWASIASWEERGLIYNGANLQNGTITVKFKMPVDSSVYKTIDFKALVWLRGGNMKAEILSLSGEHTEFINIVSAGNDKQAREADLDVKVNAQLLGDENGLVEGFKLQIVDDNTGGHFVFSEMHGGTEEKQYKVIYKAEGADDIVKTYTSNSTFEEPAVPSREHYENGRWNKALNDVVKNYSDTPEVVEAIYDPIEYTVTFKAEGAQDIVEHYTVKTKDSFKAPAVPARTHYTGVWEAYTLNYDNAQVVNADYTATVYTVTFKAEGAQDIVKTYTVETKDSFEAPAVPEKEGFEGKWGEYELNYENITVEAVYTEILDGCASSVTGTIVPLFALLGVALVFKRKKQD